MIEVTEDLSGYTTTQKAAGFLGYTRRHVAQLCQRGDFPGAIKMGRDWLIPTADVASYRPGPQGFAAVKAKKEAAAARAGSKK